MFNIAAADFIPSSSSEVVDTQQDFFAYTINSVPLEKSSSISLGSITDCLTSEALRYEFPLRTENVLDYVSKNFQSLQPLIKTRGFLLSRRTLQDDTSIHSCGVLIPLEVEEKSTAMMKFLFDTWRSFFNYLVEVDSAMSLGYVRHSISLDSRSGKLADKHFFFATCVDNDKVQLLNKINTFTKLSRMPFEKRFLIKSIIPFICAPQTALSVIVTVGMGEKNYGDKVHFSKLIVYNPQSMTATYESLKSAEDYLFETLENGCENNSLFHIHIQVSEERSKRIQMSIAGVIRFIGNMCNRSLVLFHSVSFESSEIAPGVEKLLAVKRNEPFFVTKTLEFPKHSSPINISHVGLGDIPSWVTVPLETDLIEKAVDVYSNFVVNGKIKGENKILLTKRVTKTAAQAFATSKFLVSKRFVGRKILIGTEPRERVFGIDIKSGSIFGLPFCFGGSTYIPPGSVFVATLSSFQYDLNEVRIIVEDVLKFGDSDLSNCSFSERWSYLTQIEMDEQNSWPHSSPLRVLILRTQYFSVAHAKIVNDTQSHCCSLGLQIQSEDEINKAYIWIPQDSLTARFVADHYENVNGVFKTYLSCVDEKGNLLNYNDEYTETDSILGIKENKVVECLLRVGEDGSHWWDLLNVSFDSHPSTVEQIDNLVHYGGITDDELSTILAAEQFICDNCQQVHDNGHRDTKNNYLCLDCWKASGHGNCVLCYRTLVVGTVDRTSNLFYCEECRRTFSRTNSNASIGYHVPPPPHATFTQQVRSRCISILIDFVNPRGPTDDVLELCCGRSVPRKWMRNKTMRYLGIDINDQEVKAQKELTDRSPDLPVGACYGFYRGDAFSEKFWTEELSQIHPRQFHTITCFSGLHNAFKDEDQCRHFLARVANALLPGGLFLGTFVDGNAMYQKGKVVTNKVYSVRWADNAVPRIGNTFQLARDKQPSKEMNVVPTDFLVPVAESFHLHAIPEIWQSFKEIIEGDASWTKVSNNDEKEYLRALRVFAFKKNNEMVLPQ